LKASHTFNYDWSRTGNYGDRSIQHYWGDETRINDAEASFVKRFGSLAQITGGAYYGNSRETQNVDFYPPNPIPPPKPYDYDDASTWRVKLGGSILSKPTRPGGPLQKDLDGLRGPMLDAGQVRWDASLSLERRRVVINSGSGQLLLRWQDRPNWVFENTLTYGFSPKVQGLADLTWRPYFITPPHPQPAWPEPTEDVLERGSARLGIVCRPTRSFQVNGFYEYTVDRSSASEIPLCQFSHERHRFSAGITWLF